MLPLPTINGTTADFPEGSTEWCTIKVNLITSRWQQNERDSERMRQMLLDLMTHGAGRVVPKSKPIGSAKTFLEKMFDTDAETAITIVARRDPVIKAQLLEILAREEAKTERPGGAKNPQGRNQHTPKAEADEVIHDDIMNYQAGTEQGTSSGYILRRIVRLAEGEPLRRKDPETGKQIKIPITPEMQQAARDALEEHRSGRLSPHGAAVRLGLIPEPDTLQQLLRLWAKATPEQRAAFAREIVDQDPNSLARACFV